MFIPISAVLFFTQTVYGGLGLGLESAGLGLGLGLETTGLGLGTLVLTTRLHPCCRHRHLTQLTNLVDNVIKLRRAELLMEKDLRATWCHLP